MPSWVLVVLVIALVLVAGMARERWRISGIERLARARGLAVRSPFQAKEPQPVEALVKRFDPDFTGRWGLGVEGEIDGAQLTIAEHEIPKTGRGNPDRWYTLVWWHVADATAAATRATAPWPHGGDLLRDSGFGAWRLPGLITPGRLETVLEHFPAARRRLE